MTRTPSSASASHAMELALKVGLPLLLVGLVVGLSSRSSRPSRRSRSRRSPSSRRSSASAVVLVVAGPWMLDQLLAYTQELYALIPS